MDLPAISFIFLVLATAQTPKDPPAKAEKIDYEARLNDLMSLGITPETNANVLLWQVFGPTPEGGRMPAEFFRRLGMPEPPRDGNYYVGITAYGKDKLSLSDNQLQGLFEQHSATRERAWTARDYPAIAEWLKLNEKPLARAREATQRPGYYNPLVSKKSADDPGALINALLPAVQKCRDLSSALAARAMLRLGEGKTEAAWDDLLATHRLGRLVARGGTLIEFLVGVAIDQIASNGDIAFLASAPLSTKQIQSCMRDLQKLPAMPSVAEKIDLGERHMGLDSLQLIRRGGGGGFLDGVNLPKKAAADQLKALEMIDWERAAEIINKRYDQMAAALRSPDRATREKAFQQIEDELVQATKDAGGTAKLAELLKKDSVPNKEIGKVVGSSIAHVLMGLLAPAIAKVQAAQDRNEQVSRNLQVAFALAAYRADNGRYPAKLDDLAPKYIAAVPGDHFAGKPLIYKPTDKGYLFYSVGPNGMDEGGRWYDDEPRGDDPRVRMPLPERKKNM